MGLVTVDLIDFSPGKLLEAQLMLYYKLAPTPKQGKRRIQDLLMLFVQRGNSPRPATFGFATNTKYIE